MLNLKIDLVDASCTHSALGRAANLSPSTVTQLVVHGKWPQTPAYAERLREAAIKVLRAGGISEERIAVTFDEAPAAGRANAQLQVLAEANTSGPKPVSQQEAIIKAF